MLWLSLHLPHLSLDVFSRGGDAAGEPGEPLAIYAAHGNRQWVHACNRAAARLGIEPGMALGAALSLSDHLQTRRRDPEAELAALNAIAAWAVQFTPVISLQPPQGPLLEIAGSLSLFGGLETLRARITQGLRALGYHVRTAVAPTPLGAWLLCRAGDGRPITDRQQLAAVLRQLPISVLERPEHILKALRGMGLRTIGDCLRLPRDGLARRLGPEFIHYLDRALGRVADPRPAFRPAARFESRVMLPAEVISTDALLFATRRLLLELSGFLLARGSGVQEIRLELFHHRRPSTHLDIGLVGPSREVEHLLGLLRERLDRHQLHAPVEAIGLRADQPVPMQHCNRDLFTEANADQQGWPQLVERLRARLGRDAVRGLCSLPDHRPERAWRYGDPGQTEAVHGVSAPRPLWLLEAPAPLKVARGEPWLDGRLTLAQGPERIESGWWDGADVARDYFVAENRRRERFWIFRELREPGRWFLHGIFG